MAERLTRAQQTALTTDRVYSALIDEVVESGWDALTFSGIARRARVTVGALYSRAESASELANMAWTDRLRDSFEATVRQLVASTRTGAISDFDAGAKAFDKWSAANPVILDLAIASLFDDELGDVVRRDISAIFSDIIWGGPGESRTRVESTASALVLFFFMGRSLAIRAVRKPKISDVQLETISRYWKAKEAKVNSRDVVPVTFVRDGSELTHSEAVLYRGVIDMLARWGYRRATVARIARAAGLTPGAVLANHATKAKLTNAAASALVVSPIGVWSQYADVVQKVGPLKARATFLSAFLDPKHSVWWKLNIELARVAVFTPELAGFKTSNDTLEHTHMGVMFVAAFVDGLHELPYAGAFEQGSAT